MRLKFFFIKNQNMLLFQIFFIGWVIVTCEGCECHNKDFLVKSDVT